ncbi:transketolase family protein [candidate division KSB1 bacterium]|nr:transketolase family protein [candidate division KSB1 bacterium]RQW00829.1 MAG: transketolase family protein [candidate division KSB1 bacterium]
MKFETGEPNLYVFAQTLLECARKDRDIIVVTSDSRGSGKLTPFGEEVPEQIVEVGIAEQNLVGIAAGLAACGKKVFAVSPASFLTARALEHIKNDVCYSNHPVKLVGISAGVSYGALGATHHSLHDVAALRAMDNIDIVVPADNFEARACVRAAVNHAKPLYIRFGKRPLPHINDQTAQYVIGKATILKDGQDVAFIATGETVHQALDAAYALESDGLTARVLSMHTLAPLDEKAILASARRCRVLITVEEHSVAGGLGEAVAALLLQNSIILPFAIVAIPNNYTTTGSQLEIFNHYGISAVGLKKTAQTLIKQVQRNVT